ncbi:hypothetical protein [Ranid herpesvirus 3]|uniref:Uncharacterized protein n=1 Tax=Ranid herpesvirus 3 TaxID=1987509 RepID=A0A1X9T5C7_9VIRU|nr:hypothetical protein [Ranid herpesvirus 3]ARR28855.1 hypothetical protein [Ranid herpesvirus 3]
MGLSNGKELDVTSNRGPSLDNYTIDQTIVPRQLCLGEWLIDPHTIADYKDDRYTQYYCSLKDLNVEPDDIANVKWLVDHEDVSHLTDRSLKDTIVMSIWKDTYYVKPLSLIRLEVTRLNGDIASTFRIEQCTMPYASHFHIYKHTCLPLVILAADIKGWQSNVHAITFLINGKTCHHNSILEGEGYGTRYYTEHGFDVSNETLPLEEKFFDLFDYKKCVESARINPNMKVLELEIIVYSCGDTTMHWKAFVEVDMSYLLTNNKT